MLVYCAHYTGILQSILSSIGGPLTHRGRGLLHPILGYLHVIEYRVTSYLVIHELKVRFLEEGIFQFGSIIVVD